LLTLVKHNFGIDGKDLAEAFMALGPNLATLDLFFTDLDKLSLENLKQIKNSYPVRIAGELFFNASELILEPRVLYRWRMGCKLSFLCFA
ncbi:MAG: hypothetical protein ACRC4N_13380, partial [Gammaproteobacteria bacterium]